MAQCAKGDGGGDKGRETRNSYLDPQVSAPGLGPGLYSLGFFFFFSLCPFVFLGPYLRHVEVLRLPVELEL